MAEQSTGPSQIVWRELHHIDALGGFFREGRTQDALSTVEKGYDEVTKYKLAPRFHNEVVKIGKAIADARGDSAAQRT